jgi:hypothetical protein
LIILFAYQILILSLISLSCILFILPQPNNSLQFCVISYHMLISRTDSVRHYSIVWEIVLLYHCMRYNITYALMITISDDHYSRNLKLIKTNFVPLGRNWCTAMRITNITHKIVSVLQLLLQVLYNFLKHTFIRFRLCSELSFHLMR